MKIASIYFQNFQPTMDLRILLFLRMISRTKNLRLILLIALPSILASIYISFELTKSGTALRQIKTLKLDKVLSRFIFLSLADAFLYLSNFILQFFYEFYCETFIAHWLYEQIYKFASIKSASDTLYTDFLLKKDAFVNMSSIVIFSFPCNITRVIIRLSSFYKNHSTLSLSVLIVVLSYFIFSYYAIRSRKTLRHIYNQKRLKKSLFCQLSFESYEVLKSENTSKKYADRFSSLSKDAAFSELLFMVYSENYRLFTRMAFVILKIVVFGLKMIYHEIPFADFLTSIDDLCLILLCIRNDAFMFFEYFFEASFDNKTSVEQPLGEQFIFENEIVLKPKPANTVKIIKLDLSALSDPGSFRKDLLYTSNRSPDFNSNSSNTENGNNLVSATNNDSFYKPSFKSLQLSLADQSHGTLNLHRSGKFRHRAGLKYKSFTTRSQAISTPSSDSNKLILDSKATISSRTELSSNGATGVISDDSLGNRSSEQKKTGHESINVAKVGEDHTLVFPKGKKIFVWSKSSNGKTTVMNHLCQNSNDYWEIEADNKPFKQIDPSSFCKKASICLQNQIIFNQSILFNLTYGTSLDRKKVEEKLAFFGITSFFEKLSEGLDTKIGNDGITLSCGQKQLIHFYRTIMKDADIYLFDEPAVFLDRVKQQHIFTVIQRLPGTVIVFSKNLDFIKGFDVVYQIQ